MDYKQYTFNMKLGVTPKGDCYWFVKEMEGDEYNRNPKIYITLLGLYIKDYNHNKGILVYHTRSEEAHIYEIVLKPIPTEEIDKIITNSDALVKDHIMEIEKLLTSNPDEYIISFRIKDGEVMLYKPEIKKDELTNRVLNTITDSNKYCHYITTPKE